MQALEGSASSGLLAESPGFDVAQKITQIQDTVKALERELARLKSKLAASQGDDLGSQAVDVNGVKVLAASLEGADAKTLRETMDQLKAKLKTAVIVLLPSRATACSWPPASPPMRPPRSRPAT